ncbi:DNA/RNA helicase domain-containing protein [Brachybacterium sp. GCM10030267]|uniref:DNA/RNA helicase domain-containing protein n=1 Tax=Brachybacterium sp. GCM10030267 TaxID=3273381 RepID=UPI00361A26E5
MRPADIGTAGFDDVIAEAQQDHRWFPLQSQMRVAGGNDYIDFVRQFLSDEPPADVPDFGNYDFRIFDHFPSMVRAIHEREEEAGLSRLVAGYAWEWVSKNDSSATDIEIDGVALQWNQTPVDWINSRTSAQEVGSIHTVQGYDLNYAGVIIGKDLQRDPATGRLVVDRGNYFDRIGKRNNTMRGQVTTDDDLLEYIRNIYKVLMTRGMRGTYVYAPHLR